MALQLAVDIGNTRTKFGLFEERELIENQSVSNQELDAAHDFIDQLNCEHIIVSSVNAEIEKQFSKWSNSPTVLKLNHKVSLPYQLNYQTPETLGKDRMAAVAAVKYFFPNQNVLVIDAGTCVTYDFLDEKGVYQGGAIAPGVQMRLKAMHDHTSQLPLLSWNQEQPKKVGDSTITSMLSGAVNGMIKEMDGFIDDYKSTYSNLKVVLTGGDSNLFEKALKNGIFADPNLVLKGLNEILIYNRK